MAMAFPRPLCHGQGTLPEPIPLKRSRLSPDESRLIALEAARDLLLEAGPQAVTLKAVGNRIGRTHANLLHHFGSAAGLQKALAGYLADAITATGMLGICASACPSRPAHCPVVCRNSSARCRRA